MDERDLWFLWMDAVAQNRQPMVRVKARDYSYDGCLSAVFRKRRGGVRAVVEDKDGRLFVHGPEQITLVSAISLSGALPPDQVSEPAAGHDMWPWKTGFRWPWQRIEQQLKDMETKIMLNLSAAIDEITRQRTVIDGAKVAFKTVTAALNDLKNHPAFDNDEAQKQLDQIVKDMRANTDAIAEGINANATTTGPAPAPSDAPTPTPQPAPTPDAQPPSTPAPQMPPVS